MKNKIERSKPQQ